MAVFVGNTVRDDAPYPTVLPPLVAASVVTAEFVAGTLRLDEPVAVLSSGVSNSDEAAAVDEER